MSGCKTAEFCGRSAGKYVCEKTSGYCSAEKFFLQIYIYIYIHVHTYTKGQANIIGIHNTLLCGIYKSRDEFDCDSIGYA